MMSDVAGWRIYYVGLEDYDSATTEWSALPGDGVLLLKIYYDEFTTGGVRYTQTLSGDDYYFHVPGTDVFGCNNHPPEETHERYPGAIIKRGRWTTRTEMKAVEALAHSEDCP